MNDHPPQKKPGRPQLRARIDDRVPSDLRAVVSCDSWRALHDLLVVNVSRTGLLLHSDRAMPTGERITVSVLLPNQRRLDVEGEVRHSRAVPGSAPATYASGIQISAAHLDRLPKLLRLAEFKLQQAAAQAGGPSAAESAPVSSRATSQPSPPAADLARVVGIDLGVCYSCVAVAQGARQLTVPNAEGQRMTPSVLYYPRGQAPVVGQAARARRALEGERVVSAIKRVLGRFYSDPMISGYLHGASYPTKPGPNDSILLSIDDEPRAVVQVCADLFAALGRYTQARLPHAIEGAVLTHPVAFDEVQKDALRKAAQMAGLTVLDLLAEPVAVALAYGLGLNRRERVAVYDFGGGTFDFTVIEFDGDQHRILVCDGDGWLGGEDFDNSLADAIANSFWRRTQVELRNRAVEWQQLLLACEQAKRELSEVDKTAILMPEVRVAGTLSQIKLPMTRAALQRICQPLLDRSLEVCQRALDGAGIDRASITTLLASGGTSRIPFVREGVQAFMGRPINDAVHPEESVALGAARWAVRCQA